MEMIMKSRDSRDLHLYVLGFMLLQVKKHQAQQIVVANFCR